MRRSEPGQQPVHCARVVDEGAEGQGNDRGDGMEPHLQAEHLRPVPAVAFGGQGIVGDSLVGAACHRFGQPAQDAVDEKDRENEGAAAERHEGEQAHFGNHAEGGGDDQPFSPDQIGESPGRHFGREDGDRPDGIEQGELLDGQAEVEKEDSEDRIVEPRIEEYPKGDKESDIGYGKRRGGGHDCPFRVSFEGGENPAGRAFVRFFGR